MSERTLRLVKGVYPYIYMDSFKKLSDRYEFVSSLKYKFTSEKDYILSYAIDVWNMLKEC